MHEKRQVGNTLLLQGHVVEAEDLLRQALVESIRTFGDKGNATLRIVSLLGLALHACKYGESELLLKNVANQARRSLSARHPVTLGGITTLGRVNMEQGTYKEAEQLLREAFVGMQQVHGNAHLEMIVVANDLGTLMVHLEQEVVQMMQRCLARSCGMLSQKKFILLCISRCSALQREAYNSSLEQHTTRKRSVLAIRWSHDVNTVVRLISLRSSGFVIQCFNLWRSMLSPLELLMRSEMQEGDWIRGRGQPDLPDVVHIRMGMRRLMRESRNSWPSSA